MEGISNNQRILGAWSEIIVSAREGGRERAGDDPGGGDVAGRIQRSPWTPRDSFVRRCPSETAPVLYVRRVITEL